MHRVFLSCMSHTNCRCSGRKGCLYSESARARSDGAPAFSTRWLTRFISSSHLRRCTSLLAILRRFRQISYICVCTPLFLSCYVEACHHYHASLHYPPRGAVISAGCSTRIRLRSIHTPRPSSICEPLLLRPIARRIERRRLHLAGPRPRASFHRRGIWAIAPAQAIYQNRGAPLAECQSRSSARS